MNTSISER